MLKNACACIVGWYYNPHVYERLDQINELDVYVVSHRSVEYVPRIVTQYVPEEFFIFEPNLGYDWGAYQQFLERGLYKKYRYVFFMHDDLEILDLGFMQECIRLLNSSSQIVGNGRHENIANWPKLEPWSYAHSAWKPPSLEFRHECVRGSFIATKSRTLNKVGNFEVFWDRMHISDVFGNWSTRATCGKFRDILGESCFGFLSENPRKSKFIIESIRGKSNGQNLSDKLIRRANIRNKGGALIKQHFIGFYRRICGLYVRQYVKRSPKMNFIWKVLKPILLWPSKC